MTLEKDKGSSSQMTFSLVAPGIFIQNRGHYCAFLTHSYEFCSLHLSNKHFYLISQCKCKTKSSLPPLCTCSNARVDVPNIILYISCLHKEVNTSLTFKVEIMGSNLCECMHFPSVPLSSQILMSLCLSDVYTRFCHNLSS